MVNTTIQYINIIQFYYYCHIDPGLEAEARTLEAEAEAWTLEAEAEAKTLEAEARTLEAKAEARTLEAEARTLEAEATKFWPREASRPRPGLEA